MSWPNPQNNKPTIMVPRQIRRIWFPYRGEGPFHSPIHWEPMQCTQRVAISPPRTEERAQRCYTKAGFKHELSRSALWGKEGHHASQWQKWTKVPTWSMWVPTDKLTNIRNSRDAEWFGFFCLASLWLSFLVFAHVENSGWQVGKLVITRHWLR